MAFKVHDRVVAKANPKWPGKITQCLGVQPGDKRTMYYCQFDHLGAMGLLYFEDTLMLESDYKKQEDESKKQEKKT